MIEQMMVNMHFEDAGFDDGYGDDMIDDDPDGR